MITLSRFGNKCVYLKMEFLNLTNLSSSLVSCYLCSVQAVISALVLPHCSTMLRLLNETQAFKHDIKIV